MGTNVGRSLQQKSHELGCSAQLIENEPQFLSSLSPCSRRARYSGHRSLFCCHCYFSRVKKRVIWIEPQSLQGFSFHSIELHFLGGKFIRKYVCFHQVLAMGVKSSVSEQQPVGGGGGGGREWGGILILCFLFFLYQGICFQSLFQTVFGKLYSH